MPTHPTPVTKNGTLPSSSCRTQPFVCRFLYVALVGCTTNHPGNFIREEESIFGVVNSNGNKGWLIFEGCKKVVLRSQDVCYYTGSNWPSVYWITCFEKGNRITRTRGIVMVYLSESLRVCALQTVSSTVSMMFRASRYPLGVVGMLRGTDCADDSMFLVLEYTVYVHTIRHCINPSTSCMSCNPDWLCFSYPDPAAY